ncbi:MAG: hypothetical protein WD646_11590 [Actinomycetota bacterium]
MKRKDALVIGAYLLLAAYVCIRYWADLDGISSYNPPDHTWFQWIFSHGAYSVRHMENPLFSIRQNFPDGVNMMANTSLLGVTLPFAPITVLAGPQLTYVLFLTLGLAATAATAYWLLSRHLVGSRSAAFVGGAFLGFAPGIISHANGQPNFVSNFLLAIIVARVLSLGDLPHRRLRSGLILGLLVTYQIFINEEMLLITALACAAIVVVYALQRWPEARARLTSFATSLSVAGVVVVVLAGLAILYQFTGPQSYRGLQAFQDLGEDLKGFVTFGRDAIAGTPYVAQPIELAEQNTWLGWPLVVVSVLIAIALWRRSLAARTTAVVGAVFAFLSLGPEVTFDGRPTGIPGPWRLIPDDLPIVELVIPTRLSLVAVGAVGVLLALAWDHAVRALRRDRPSHHRAVSALTIIAITAALIPILPRPLPTESGQPLPRFITSNAWRRFVPDGRTLVPVPIPSFFHGVSTLRWSASTQHAFAVPAGYFVGPDRRGRGIWGAPYRPTTSLVYAAMDTGVVPSVTAADADRAIEDLTYWRASVVVLGKHPDEATLRELMTRLLGSPRRIDDVWLWDVRELVGDKRSG